MPINYVDKPGLDEALAAKNYRVEQIGTTWVGYRVRPDGTDRLSTGEDAIATAINDIIATYNPLLVAQRKQRQAIREAAIEAVKNKVRPITDYDTLLWLIDMWRSLAPAAQQPNRNIQDLVAIHTKATGYLAEVSAATDWLALTSKNYADPTLWV